MVVNNTEYVCVYFVSLDKTHLSLHKKIIHKVIKSFCPPTNSKRIEDEFSDFSELRCVLIFSVAPNHQNNATIGFLIHENLWKVV